MRQVAVVDLAAGKAAGLVDTPIRSVCRVGDDGEAVWTRAENALIIEAGSLPTDCLAFVRRVELGSRLVRAA